MSEYQFTQDWFSHNIPVWEQLVTLLPSTPGQRIFLEIGSFEGRSAVWLMENAMQKGDFIFCIDTWEGSEEHEQLDMLPTFDTFKENTRIAAKRTGVKRGYAKNQSRLELGTMQNDGNLWDFIYIDGSHTAKDVLTDACMAWPLLKQGGLMVFDDYLWGESRDILHRPKLAVDFFVNTFAEGLDIVHIGHQFAVRKK